MEINIRAGQRILYKDSKSGWKVGIIDHGQATIDERGLLIPIIPIEFATIDPFDISFIQYIEINNLFLEAEPVENWMNLIPKQEYIKVVSEEDFEKEFENAWVSDGEYFYYPVSKYTKNWLEKQPFEYIIRG